MHGTIEPPRRSDRGRTAWQRLLGWLKPDPRPWERAGVTEREWTDDWSIR